MIKRLGLFLLALLIAVPVMADDIYYAPQVTGKRERKNMRHLLYLYNLTGDMKAVYDEYGYTPHRIRVNGYGQIRQQWTYLEIGKVFVFDQQSNLVETHSVNVEHRRAWAYQRDMVDVLEGLPIDD